MQLLNKKLLQVLLFLIIINFCNAENNKTSGVEILQSNSSELIVAYTPVQSGFKEITLENGRKTYLPIIEGTSPEYSNPGFPSDLVYSANFVVPSSDGFRIHSILTDGNQTYNYLLAPIPKIKLTDLNEIKTYYINNEAYSKNYFSEKAYINYLGLSREHHLARLSFRAATYNPNTNQIEIPKRVVVKITFQNRLKSSLSQPINKGFLASNVLNPAMAKYWSIPAGMKADKINKNEILSDDKISSGNWFKLSVENEGIIKLDARTLREAGANIPANDIQTIKVFGYGGKELSENQTNGKNNNLNEIPVIVRKNSSGELESIIFYGSAACGFNVKGNDFKHYINHYSTKNSYLLTWGGRDGRRAIPQQPATANSFIKPVNYIERIFFEEELNNPYIIGSGRTWFGRQNPTTMSTITLPNLDRNNDILFRFSLAHRSDSQGEFKVFEKDFLITTISIPGTSDDAYCVESTAYMPASKISQDNLCMLRFEYTNPKGNAATSFFDYYEIQYSRSLVPINDTISFFSDTSWNGPTEITINSFGGSEILGFDVTDKSNPILLTNCASTGGMYIIRKELLKEKPERFFVSSVFLKPSIEKTGFGYLRNDTTDCDFVIISSPYLLESAENYKNYRSKHNGLKGYVISTEHIYNEFAGGIQDPTAIRDFLSYTINHWKKSPEFVILWGSGHYDYKNITTNSKNHIPPYETIETTSFDNLGSYPCDDYFVRLAGGDWDALPDMVIGRIPVSSNNNGTTVLEKIKHYEESSSKDNWRTSITFLADDSFGGDQDNNDTFSNQSEALAGLLPDYFQQNKIYLVEYKTDNIPGGRRKSTAQKEMLNKINNSGTLFLNWIGHGNPRVWAHEELLERDNTIPLMVNYDKLFFTCAATCDFGRFDKPEVQSGAEKLFLSPIGGSIGVFSASRSVFASENFAINKLYIEMLFRQDSLTGQYPTIGEALFQTKQQNSSVNDQKFYLLGDPSMRLIIPTQKIVIDSIDGIALKDLPDTVKFKALQNINISGAVLKINGKAVDESFNGVAITAMLDGDVQLIAKDDYDGTLAHIEKFGSALNRSFYKIQNGKFSARFIIPKDISYSANTGRFMSYGYSDDSRFAKGSYRNFVIQGLVSGINPDNNGPKISLYLDSRKFLPYSTVRKNPLLIVDLEDESGINTTGRGIGHKIEAWVDDNSESIDLTDKFETSLVNPKGGSVVDYIYGLGSGLHAIKVRAWDVFNNFSEETTYFNIQPEEDGIVINNLICFPNPAADITTFRFEHNVSPPFNAQIDIYSALGDKVGQIRQTVNTPYQSDISSEGILIPLSQGIYYFNLTIYGSKGNSGSKPGILSIVK
ncbi:MAG: hypothetical protein HW421_950 [Ignavibacteria bacterium]|nr:hypothetical protein [Ignavibacteria bacterium]